MLKGGVDNDDGIVSDDPLHNTDMSSLSFDAGMSLFNIHAQYFLHLLNLTVLIFVDFWYNYMYPHNVCIRGA